MEKEEFIQKTQKALEKLELQKVKIEGRIAAHKEKLVNPERHFKKTIKARARYQNKINSKSEVKPEPKKEEKKKGWLDDFLGED